MTWRTDIEQELLAQACYDSFWQFVRIGFGVARNPDGAWLDPNVHKPLCDWIQGICEKWLRDRHKPDRERTYVLIDAARGAGKSVVITKALTVWLHLHEPNLASVIDSYTATKSEEFIDVIRKLYENRDPCALFSWLYGRWEGTDPWTKSRFTHKARFISRSEASVETSAVEIGIAGEHPDHVVSDDLITREKLRDEGNWIQLAKKHVASLHPALKNSSLYIMCATPYEDGDVVTSAIREDGIKEVFGHTLPLEYRQFVRPDGKWYVYFMPGADENDTPLMPTVWSKADLAEYRRKWPADYSAQVLLRPGAGAHVPLTMDQIEECLCDRKDVPRNMVYTIHMDTAFKDLVKIGTGDDSVIEVWGHHQGTGDVYFIEGYGTNTWRSEDFLNKLVAIVQRYRNEGKRIAWMTDEQALSGKAGSWKTVLQSAFSNAGAEDGGPGMWMPPYLEIRRSTRKNDKVTRITEAAAYWVDGHVRLVRDAPGLSKLMWQMARIGVSDHNDWADAAADVFNPQIYRPLLPTFDENAGPPIPVRPGDYYLKTGRLSNEGAQMAYDSYIHSQAGYSPREPVGR